MWPEDVQCGVTITFDLDIETAWVAEDRNNAQRLSVMSLAHYAPRVGVPLILSMLDRLDAKGTFFIPGKSAEDFPETVESIVREGHELAVHGYTHDPPASLSREEEESQLKRTTKILRAMGVSVTGYRAPLYEISEHTFALLKKYELSYSSNLMDDIKPYRHETTGIIELPVQWIMDDWTQFNHGADELPAQNATCAHMFQLWMEEFHAIHEQGGLFNLTLHPQVIGRPSRIKMLEDLILEIRKYEGVWMTNCSSIAAHFIETL